MLQMGYWGGRNWRLSTMFGSESWVRPRVRERSVVFTSCVPCALTRALTDAGMIGTGAAGSLLMSFY